MQIPLTDTMKEPMFFYTVAFVIFTVLAYIYGRKPMLGWIDGQIGKIDQELSQARALRQEAETALAGYKLKQQAAMDEAALIVRQAQDDAARLRQQSAADLKNALGRYEQQAAQRIQLAETEAVEAVRRVVVDLAIKQATATLQTQAKNGLAERLSDRALAELPALLGKSAKAA